MSCEIKRRRNSLSMDKPLLVGLAGIPGSGKTFASSFLASRLSNIFVIPMDRYHFSIQALSEKEGSEDLIYRRGAPDTFDTESLYNDLKEIRKGIKEVWIPHFDHAKGDPEPNASCFRPCGSNIVICEGLYLLNRSLKDWQRICDLFDLKIFLKADIDECIERLKIRNRCIPGYTIDEIERRCDLIDRKNAVLVSLDCSNADLALRGY